MNVDIFNQTKIKELEYEISNLNRLLDASEKLNEEKDEKIEKLQELVDTVTDDLEGICRKLVKSY